MLVLKKKKKEEKKQYKTVFRMTRKQFGPAEGLCGIHCNSTGNENVWLHDDTSHFSDCVDCVD